MSNKKVNETTSSKILNSDIYDITRFVDDIKKQHIDGIDSNKETLLIGMYGYLGYQFSSLLQNAIVTASELSNEAIPTRAKFDRNVITHALSLGVKKVAATAANMKVIIMFPERALRANMIDGRFVFKADTPLRFDEYEFHIDYDIEINYVNLKDSNNGSKRSYVYTAKYIMDETNPISDIDNPFLPPVAVFNYIDDNMIAIATTLHQVYYREINEKILSSDVIANKTLSFSFDKQMSHFIVECQEPSTQNAGGEGRLVTLIPVYDGLYNREIADKNYVYYQYINPNTIRLRFDPTNYQPPANSDIKIRLYTTDGEGGNFDYSEEVTIRLTSDRYTNLYCIIAQRGEDGSSGGLDRQSIEDLQHIIPKEALSRGCITTNTDLTNFFNSLNNENSVLHVFRKEDNILNRIYYVYNLMKDSENNVVPTNTIPIYLEGTRRDKVNGKIYLESGTPIYYYRFGDGASGVMKNNYIGYLEQKIANNETNYSFYNGDGITTYQGTPTDDTLELWYSQYRNSFDPNVDMGEDYKMLIPKPTLSYDFFKNATIYFKAYWSQMLDANRRIIPSSSTIPGSTIEDIEELYSKYFYGTCVDCELKKFTIDTYPILNNIKEALNGVRDVCNYEIEFTSGSIITHFPMRDTDTINPEDIEDCLLVNRDAVTGDIISIAIIDFNKVSNVYFFRTRERDINGNIMPGSISDRCQFKMYVDYRYDELNRKIDMTPYLYMWMVRITFEDESGMFVQAHGGGNSNKVNRWFYVPDSVIDITSLNEFNKQEFINDFVNEISGPYHDANANFCILDTINTIDVYSYDGQGEYGFDDLSLTEGDLIRFDTYSAGGSEIDKFAYKDPTTWALGEVLSIERNNGRIISVELLVKDEELGNFDSKRYRLPVPIDGTSTTTENLDSTCIILISKISKFLYTTPLSIVLEDDPNVNTHRITASYYLDIINETRYQEYDCINSKSPIQFILSYIHTYRSSYLSDNRYKYTIQINIKPNIGNIDIGMINRTQVIGVFYKNGKPIMYSIASHKSINKHYIDENGNEVTDEVIYDEEGIHYEMILYTRPFTTSDKTDNSDDNYRVDIVDDNNDVYIGTKQIISELKAKYGDDEQSAIEEFFTQYKMYNADANNSRPLSINDLPSGFGLDDIGKCPAYVNTIYMNLNTELKIYILYKYNNDNTIQYTDGLTKEYLSINSNNTDALYNSVSQYTKFTEILPTESTDKLHTPDYILKDMVLTNVYNTYKGINLLHDYSNIMNSYVTSLKTNDVFNPDSSNTIESYIINRVPCVRYFYWNREDRVLDFLKDMKKKIDYVLDAIDPLECTFGLDYKFFNTYGPSNMYHLTDDDGDTAGLIDNVALTMTFKAKFYNENQDSNRIDEIKNAIKDYLEKLDQLDDIHFPNVTTLIESQFSEYLIYFEFVSFNIYNATEQHIITDENMEMLSMVPEFLHVDTNDLTGKPFINIRIVTT